jgi:hypothetical protein
VHTRFYELYGLRLAITAEPVLLDALHGRLRFFAAGGSGPGGCSFVFRRIKEREPAFPQSTSDGRPVYDTPAGAVLYADATERLTITQTNRIRASCDIVSGSVVVEYQETTDDSVWLLSHPFLTLPLIELLKRDGRYSLHAAGFCVDGRALLFPAPSGAGKSTLALALLRAGLDFLGDDMAFLAHEEQELRVLSFPDELDLTDETLTFFPEFEGLLDRPKRPGWPKRQVRADDCFGAKAIQDCKPGALIFPQIGRRHHSRLQPMDRDAALMELLPNVLLTEPRAARAHFDALAELVQRSECYRLETGWDFDALPGHLRSLLS